jgi:zinc protease
LDAEELEVIRAEQVTGLQSQLAEPDALAPLTVIRALSPYPRGDARYVASIAEEIEDVKKVTLADIREVYSQLIGGSVGELVAVGDFDPAMIKNQVERLVQDWRSAIPFERVASPANTMIDGQEKIIETPDKANSVFYASQQYAMRDDDPKYPALSIGNYILGAGALSSRLGDRVRQKEGLSYGVSSGLSSHPIDQRTSLTIFAITNPANRDKLVAVIREEIDKLLDGGITQEELDKAKKGYLESLQVARSNDQSLVQALSGSLFAKRTMAHDEKFEAQVAALKVEDVNDAVRQYIVPDRLVIATAGDFANAKATEAK